MSPEFLAKWEHILEDVEKSKIPIQFIKKLVVRLQGKRQHTINIERLMNQGLEPEDVEDVLNRKLEELDPLITSVEFILNISTIADCVQPITDDLLKSL
jgi:hypothetical protein